MTLPTPRYWRVIFSATGAIESVRELTSPPDETWIILIADDAAEAKRKAINLYCARKKKLAKERLHANGQCRCGRQQDRTDEKGKPMLTCSTCAERQAAQNERFEARKQQGVTNHVRDEGARVAVNMERQRDRRGEIRLETLLEVRKQWQNSRNVGSFTAWVEIEIKKLTGEMEAS